MFVVWNVFIVIIGGQLVSYQKYKNRIEICKKRFQKFIITHLYNINDKKIVPFCVMFSNTYLLNKGLKLSFSKGYENMNENTWC